MSFTGTAGERLKTVGLFSGIGGIELGFERAGHSCELLCEIWEPAQAVLEEHFASVPLEPDVRALTDLPQADVVAAGFPCTDLSQAGRTAGIHGKDSGLVGEVFRLIRKSSPRWLVLENVHNMLVLDRGQAMEYLVGELDSLGYRWAYRVVDSRFTGVPQRRHRVLLVASRTEDPRSVLFADDAGEPGDDHYRDDAFGFYWTEGLRGLGWAPDAIPPLKGGSTIGIPSPPAVWLPAAQLDRRFVKPSITDAERLQGFPSAWTIAAERLARKGVRWKLVGNAVTVGVAEWLGRRLGRPADRASVEELPLEAGTRWPSAAWGESGKRWRVSVSMWPERRRYRHLWDLLDLDYVTPLSHKAASGFHERMDRAKLTFDPNFKRDMKEYVALTTQLRSTQRAKPLAG